MDNIIKVEEKATEQSESSDPTSQIGQGEASIDENDSSCLKFMSSKAKLIAINQSNDSNSGHMMDIDDDNSTQNENILQQIPTIVCKKPLELANVMPKKMVQVRPVSLVSPNKPNQSSNKPRIDAIVDNLKINLMQKDKQTKVLQEITPPKVSRIIEKLPYEARIKIAIKKLEELDESMEINDDLSNLNWLNNFKLNIEALSPPQSPPLAADEADGAPIVSKVNTHLVRPWISGKPINPPKKVAVVQTKCSTEAISQKNVSNLKQRRPTHSFSLLTFLAIETSQRKRLSVKEIYSWITENFPYYCNVPSGSWKNSIRLNLSQNTCFCKVDKNLLAMRDFSGKGSLWCVNPVFRPMLVSLMNPDSLYDQAQLANVACLRDVCETVKTNTLSLVQQPRIGNKMNKKRTSNAISTPSITINPRLIQAPSLNTLCVPPKVTPVTKEKNSNSMLQKSQSTISALTKNLQNKSSHLNKVDSFDDECSEMDAVSALLSMKARSSSMPISFDNRIQSHPKSNNSSINESAANLDDPSSSNRRGRRKQLFKTPTKRSLDDYDDLQNLNSNSNDTDGYNSYDLNDLEEEKDGKNDDDNDEDEMEMEESCDEDKAKTSKSEQKRKCLERKSDHKEPTKSHTTKKPNKKLLIKLPCFNSKKNSKQANNTNSSNNDETENSEASNSLIERKSLREHSKASVDSNSTTSECMSLPKDEASLMHNALLELSRAASLVEQPLKEASKALAANVRTNVTRSMTTSTTMVTRLKQASSLDTNNKLKRKQN